VRSGECQRASNETSVAVAIDLEACGENRIETGVIMLDHLLEQFRFHSGCSLVVAATSLDSILHHIVEDVALVAGQALSQALGPRLGIARFGEATIPMDDALARAVLDLGGRPYARTQLRTQAECVERLDVILIPHFFRSLATTAGLTVHIDVLTGSDPHHCIEAAFKAFAYACRSAWAITSSTQAIPSTKGVL
jgi:imidazoleglycerol-phosphate dehydratase